jgi:molecular chaperone Hsp33
VTRDAGFEIGLLKEPYHGSVPIVSGEIAEDFAFYLAKSEQVNSAVSIGVLMVLDPDGNASPGGAPVPAGGNGSSPEFSLDRLRVAAAGGYIIQTMPSADERVLRHLERTVSTAPQSTDMVRAGLSPAEMLKEALGDLDLTLLEEQNPRFHCQCSRERALFMISALGREEVLDMLTKDNGAELRCHFCNEVYQVTGEELKAMLDEAGTG